jgi:hypothetical protein
MAIHVQDPEADRMLRDFASRRKLGLTAAIKVAVREADARESTSLEDLQERIAPLIAEVKARMTKSYDWKEEKAFMDEMWGEEPD